MSTNFLDRCFLLVRSLPPVAKKLENEVARLEADLEHTLRPQGRKNVIRTMPTKSRPAEDVLDEMRALAMQDRTKWESGKASGAVYHGGVEHTSLLGKAYSLFSHSNPLHPDIWPSALKFESEVVSMTARLLDGGNEHVCGALTSGGTESIVLAAKAHRDYYSKELGVTSPEIVAATSAHAAIEKACSLLGIRLIKVPMDPVAFKADVAAMRAKVGVNTIMIYASAPSFPQGTIDPVQELAALARQSGAGLHVDCCLGGFVLPFAQRLGYTVPPFDFGVEGVTSMSVDTHKYGFASKGTSVVLYHNKKLRHHQYFCFPRWTGGLYVTPTIAGSRPGGLTAACWASMVSMGEEGYEASVKSIMETVKVIANGVQGTPNLELMGQPEAMIVCFRGEGCNTYDVGDAMLARGWSLNALQRPPCLHLCVTLCHVGKTELFLGDLRSATAEATAKSKQGGATKKDGTAAIYGMAGSMPAGPVNVLLEAYTDLTLQA